MRLVFSSLSQRGYFAPVRGINMVHGSIPPLGPGLIELIVKERRTAESLLRDPPANFDQAVAHIQDWLNLCRQSKAFCDLAAPEMPRPERLVAGKFPYLPLPRLHRCFWKVDTLAEAADNPARL